MNNESIFEQTAFHYDINSMPARIHSEFFPMHWHKFMEIIFVSENEAPSSKVMIRTGSELYTLRPGDILLIWPGELHEVYDNKDKCFSAIQFSLSLLDNRREFASFIRHFRKYHLLSMEENPERNLSMLFSLNQILTLGQEDNNSFHEVEMLISLYETFISFGNDINRQNHDNPEFNKESFYSEQMLKAQEYIQQNCELDISLNTMAEYTGFSPCYFSRYFKKATDYNFVEYLIRQRIKKFQGLLADDTLSITDAAYQAGFKSISTLNRTFRQVCGCSPSEYRKYYLNEYK